LSPLTSEPTAYKPLYDIFSYLVTQITFSFVVAPFYLLRLAPCWQVWLRVYMYAIVGTILSTAFFASPAKGYLKKLQAQRVEKAGGLKKSQSQESLYQEDHPLMTLPPQESIDEAVKEIREEIEARQRRGVVRMQTL
jgi:lysophospholipid acyltransferase